MAFRACFSLSVINLIETRKFKSSQVRGLSMFSPLFYHPLLYRIFTMFYYKSQYQLRYKIITEEIKDGWVVNDICCGDAYLYEHLKKINASYQAYDINKI